MMRTLGGMASEPKKVKTITRHPTDARLGDAEPLRVVMDDGSQQDFSKNDVMLLPPGHDAWSVGNEPCVFVEFSRGNDYYTGEHGH